MRKLAVAVAAAAVLAVATMGVVQAGSGPRLNGTFKVTATILNNDMGIPSGTVTADVYTFKSTCGSGGCPKVDLTRKSGNRNVKSSLRKTAPGVYTGTEGPQPYTCITPLGAKGQFTGDHSIKVTKAKNGLAQTISGKTVIHITGCKETVEEIALKGKLSR
jgi:hypothetical protein